VKVHLHSSPGYLRFETYPLNVVRPDTARLSASVTATEKKVTPSLSAVSTLCPALQWAPLRFAMRKEDHMRKECNPEKLQWTFSIKLRFPSSFGPTGNTDMKHIPTGSSWFFGELRWALAGYGELLSARRVNARMHPETICGSRRDLVANSTELFSFRKSWARKSLTDARHSPITCHNPPGCLLLCQLSVKFAL